MYMYIYIYTYMYVCTYMYIYIYIYRRACETSVRTDHPLSQTLEGDGFRLLRVRVRQATRNLPKEDQGF